MPRLSVIRNPNTGLLEVVDLDRPLEQRRVASGPPPGVPVRAMPSREPVAVGGQPEVYNPMHASETATAGHRALYGAAREAVPLATLGRPQIYRRIDIRPQDIQSESDARELYEIQEGEQAQFNEDKRMRLEHNMRKRSPRFTMPLAAPMPTEGVVQTPMSIARLKRNLGPAIIGAVEGLEPEVIEIPEITVQTKRKR